MKNNEGTSDGTPAVERLTYNKREALVALGIHATTLYRLEQRGLIRSVPGLRHKLYSVESIKRFVNGKTA
jgi:predicted site-specific integrase-resolvase